jgi:hypothetical protein
MRNEELDNDDISGRWSKILVTLKWKNKKTHSIEWVFCSHRVPLDFKSQDLLLVESV